MSLAATVSANTIIPNSGLSGKGTYDNPYLIKLSKHQQYNEQGQAYNNFSINVPHQAKHIYLIIHVPHQLKNQIKSLVGASVAIKNRNKMYGRYSGMDSNPNDYPYKNSVQKKTSNQCVGISSGVSKGAPHISQVCTIINNPKRHKNGGTFDPLFPGYYKMSITIKKPLPSTIADFMVGLTKLEQQTNNFNEG